MRRMAAWCLVLCGACGEDPVTPDAGIAVDAAVDGGSLSLACGAATCEGTAQYCRVTPTGACVALDGGACAGGQESCQVGGVVGCTSPQAQSCEPIPNGCRNCPCITLTPVCAGTTNASCTGLSSTGFTVSCPFPSGG